MLRLGRPQLMTLRKTTTTVLSLALALPACTQAAVSQEISKQDKIQGAFFGALVADALTLGSHYEYDATKIKQVRASFAQRLLRSR